jgi:hypothetical protein
MSKPIQTTGTKVCTTCNIEKPINEFYLRGGNYSPNSRKAKCKSCDILRVRKRHQDNPERTKNNDLKRLYGITLNEYTQMLTEQNNQCAVCHTTDPGGKHKKFMVDHCHTTGKVRGLLCKRCNIALGEVNDNIGTLQAMVEYLSTNTH